MFPAPVRERGPRKSKCTFFMELFAWKLLKAVCDGHAYFDSTYHIIINLNIRFCGPLSLCAAYLCTKSQRYNRSQTSPTVVTTLDPRVNIGQDNPLFTQQHSYPFLIDPFFNVCKLLVWTQHNKLTLCGCNCRFIETYFIAKDMLTPLSARQFFQTIQNTKKYQLDLIHFSNELPVDLSLDNCRYCPIWSTRSTKSCSWSTHQ